MRAALERWLLARWYGGRRPGLFLRLLASIFGWLLAARAYARKQGWWRAEELPVPVIVIGNFTAGGTGKTPLCIALVEHFLECGWKPGVLSRGHGRQSRLPLRVQDTTPASDCGDEPLLVFRRTGVPVQVDRDRVRAARALVSAGCNLLLADDGLQHHRLRRDIEIEVRDGQRGLGNGRLLPAGPLRELPRPVDFCVVNGGEAGDGWAMQLQLQAAVALADGQRRELAGFAGQPVHALAGIGHPERFFSALRARGLSLVAHEFPDHHAFVAADLAALGRPLLMTEKDAVKCAPLAPADAWQVPVATCLPPLFFDRLDACLAAVPRPGSGPGSSSTESKPS